MLNMNDRDPFIALMILIEITLKLGTISIYLVSKDCAKFKSCVYKALANYKTPHPVGAYGGSIFLQWPKGLYTRSQ